MTMVDSVKEFFWGIALKKGVQAGIKAAAGLLMVKAGLLAKFGVTIDFDTFQAAGVAALIAALEILRNYAKQKTGLKFL